MSYAITGIGPSGSPAEGLTGGLGALGGDAFLELLVAQLRYQNPLQPTDPSSMLAQTAQFTTVETLKAISEVQQQLVGLQQVVGAIGVIGREVTALLEDGTEVAGTAEAVRLSPEGPMLRLGGTEVPFAWVLEIEPAPSQMEG